MVSKAEPSMKEFLSYFSLPKRYALDVGNALQHCHRNKIIHLDVKPQNIVIDFQDHCKLCDFGSSRIMDTEDGAQTPWPVRLHQFY
jgi:serine/threonine protein kinase